MASYPEGLLRSGERVHEHLRPHWRMLVVPALLPAMLAAPTGFLAALVSAQTWRTVVWVALALLIGGLLWWFSLAPLARWRCTHLVITDRRLLVREGVVSRNGIDVAASTVTAVRIRQGVLERMLGCGTLVVVTRDAPEGEHWEFDGIPHVARLATTLEEVAEDRGGLDPEPPLARDLDDELDDELDEDLDDDRDEDPAPAGRRASRGELVLRPRGRVVRTSR